MGRRDLKFRLLLLKFYFDKGFGLTNYFKYVFAFSGLFNFINAKQAIYIAFVYVILCFILGYYWTKHKLTDTENDVNNTFNPFVQDTLKLLSKNKKFK